MAIRTMCVAVVLAASAVVTIGDVPTFYSLDTEQPSGNPMKLVSFPSNPGDGQNLTVIADVPGLPSTPLSACMDLSNDGQLFVAPLGNTIYAVDPATGSTLGSVSITDGGGDYISGVAVSSSGMLYINQDINPGARLWSIDFATQQTTLLMTTSTKIDDIDFDGQGNLIGEDLNDSGNMYRIPLDGSQPTAIADLGIQPVTIMTYSSGDDALYFKSGLSGQTLYRVAWSGGLPAGAFEQIDTIGPGHYVGLAVTPEPTTLSLLALGGLALVRRRKCGMCR
jgi:WD40 repeat protein